MTDAQRTTSPAHDTTSATGNVPQGRWRVGDNVRARRAYSKMYEDATIESVSSKYGADHCKTLDGVKRQEIRGPMYWVCIGGDKGSIPRWESDLRATPNSNRGGILKSDAQ